MHIASGVMMADGLNRVGHGAGGVVIAIVAWLILTGGKKTTSSGTPKPKSKVRKGSGWVLVAVAIIVAAGGGGGAHKPSTPSTPTHTNPPAVTTHKPVAPKPTPHNNGNTNSCAGKIICFHN